MKNINKKLVAFIVAILLVWLLASFKIFIWLDIDGANVLIAGFAFVALIHSLDKQKESINQQTESLKKQDSALKLQHEDLVEQRKEMELNREEMKMQNETLKIQRFENTFFNMLNLHHEIVNHIDIDESRFSSMRELAEGNSRLVKISTHTARDAFKFTYNELKEKIKNRNDQENFNLGTLNTIYNNHYNKYKTDFGHYFRNLYRILKTIDQYQFHEDGVENFKEQYRYASILRAQLSDYELLWIYYNCITKNGIKFFWKFIVKYSFLKNLSKLEIINNSFDKYYLDTAFNKPNDIAQHLIMIDSEGFISPQTEVISEIF